MNKPVVLCIDDDRMQRTLLEAYLAGELPNYNVVAAPENLEEFINKSGDDIAYVIADNALGHYLQGSFQGLRGGQVISKIRELTGKSAEVLPGIFYSGTPPKHMPQGCIRILKGPHGSKEGYQHIAPYILSGTPPPPIPDQDLHDEHSERIMIQEGLYDLPSVEVAEEQIKSTPEEGQNIANRIRQIIMGVEDDDEHRRLYNRYERILSKYPKHYDPDALKPPPWQRS